MINPYGFLPVAIMALSLLFFYLILLRSTLKRKFLAKSDALDQSKLAKSQIAGAKEKLRQFLEADGCEQKFVEESLQELDKKLLPPVQATEIKKFIAFLMAQSDRPEEAKQVGKELSAELEQALHTTHEAKRIVWEYDHMASEGLSGKMAIFFGHPKH